MPKMKQIYVERDRSRSARHSLDQGCDAAAAAAGRTNTR